MNCVYCNTPNDNGAKFCKNCGQEIKYAPVAPTPNADQSVNYILFAVGIGYFFAFISLIFQKVFVPIFFKKDGVTEWDKVDPIYRLFDWATGIIEIIVFIVFAVLVKNTMAKVFLFVFAFLRLLFLVAYRVFPS